MKQRAFAERELLAAGLDPNSEEDGPDKWVAENVLELIDTFSKQGHSGFSAPIVVDIFQKLVSWEPLVPLTGEDDEWEDVSEWLNEPLWQNNRCSRVFKGADGRAYDIEGRIFRDPDGSCWTNHESRVYIDFPYTPVREYIDREPT